MKLFVAGVSYKATPVETRELVAVKPSEMANEAGRLKSHGGLAEIVLLSTCNRVEIYGVARHANERVDSLFRMLGEGGQGFEGSVYVYEDLAAASHLFRVASGLDSLVLGETEITSQVKNAYEVARTAQHTGSVLNRTFQKAFQTLKAIRTQTNIGRGATTIGSVATELVGRFFGQGLAQKEVMIIGAGQMGESCIRHLAKKGVASIVVSNRSLDRAVELAKEFGGRALPFDQCLPALEQADIVIAATACPTLLLRRSDLEKLLPARRKRPLLLLDLSVPRNFDPEIQGMENVYLFNIDDFETILRENISSRRKDLAVCERIIHAQAAALMAKLDLETSEDRAVLQTARSGWLSSDVTNFAGRTLFKGINLASS